VLLANGVNVSRLRLCCRRTFWAHAKMKMWCDTCVFLSDKKLPIAFVANELIISEPTHMLPSIGIHCCQWPNCDFCISHGSVATTLRWGGQNYRPLRPVFLNVACQKLLKSANVSWSYWKILVACFYGPRYIEGNTAFQQFTCQ